MRSEKMSSRWERLNSTFSVLPALLTAGAALLFFVTQHLDQATRTSLESLPILFSGGSSAARSVLSAISGSVITVVATVFSLTIVALQLASSQYSPRVLRNFTSDRGVQLVLGAYIATFLYSLLVLRIIRSPAGATEAFVPKISVTVAILLALACVGLLVYFVSHIATIIQSSTIVQRAHTDAARTIANLEDLDGCPAGEETSEDPPAGDPLVLRAQRSGYVQHVDVEALAEALTGDEAAGKTTVEVQSGPGRFVPAGSTVLKVWPARELTERAEEGAHGALVLGRERSFQGDFAFGLRQLSDIALKGLSPAVNDPTTAMQAMDRMEAIFVALGEKRMPARKREREANGTRVVIMVGHYGFDDVVGLERLLEILELAIRPNEPPDRRRSLWARAFTIGRLSPERVADPEDAARLVARATDVGERLSRDGGGPAVSRRPLQGSARGPRVRHGGCALLGDVAREVYRGLPALAGPPCPTPRGRAFTPFDRPECAGRSHLLVDDTDPAACQHPGMLAPSLERGYDSGSEVGGLSLWQHRRTTIHAHEKRRPRRSVVDGRPRVRSRTYSIFTES